MFWNASDFLVPVALSFTLAVAFTPLVRALARRVGMVAKPRLDRWHQKPTALLGGVAILAAVVVVCIGFVPWTEQTVAIVAASSALGILGLVDDCLRMKPYQKLLGQVLGASLVLSTGLSLPWTMEPLINMAATLFWLVGITNAINLLDNMDGLAAGIAAIAAVFLTVFYLDTRQTTEGLMLAVFAAALAGFLVYNSFPASIFMGDCGSMFVGFFLASAALPTVTGGRSRSLLPVIVVPILVLYVPIFDTTLVTLMRKLAGRPIAQGGRDHASHRLVALGMSERRAVWLLYGLAALSGFLALLVRNLRLGLSLAIIFAFTAGITALGVYLARVKVYSVEEKRNDE